MSKLLFLALVLCSISISYAQNRQSFDEGWKFFRGAAINAESVEFDDAKWRDVIVPHDFSVEPLAYTSDYRMETAEWKEWQIGPFSRLCIGDSDSGQMTGGEGWYRKTFELPIIDGESVKDYLKSHTLRLRFDGVYNQAEVWVNGKKAAINVFGYMPFVVNLNDVLEGQVDNSRQITIAVKSVNEGINCRWYSGSGMYRHVWLETSEKLYLDEWDTYIDASHVSGKGNKQTANIKFITKVFSKDGMPSDGLLKLRVIDAQGYDVVAVEKPLVSLKSGEKVEMDVTLSKPKLWSVDSPYRYTARVSVEQSGKVSDVLSIPFGIRTIEFSVSEGFKLNGVATKLRGGCVHHDNGLLGGAAIDRAEVRKVELMKAQGYNAIRCSHNLPTVAFLNACDSIGMLVIDECFDQWEESKRKDDYSNYFSKEKMMMVDHVFKGIGKTNFEHDAALMVRRDRNHPSVIMWSIGNEIAQRSDIPRGKEIALAITKAIKGEDVTRPTTMAVNDYWDRTALQMNWDQDSPRAFENVEIGGYNYETRRYEPDHEKYPERIMYGSETYPNAVASNWNIINKNPYILGDFVWTAIDYIGECGLGHALERSDHGRWIQLLAWPWFNAWCGDIDLVGIKKPQSYYRDVVWGVRPISMAVRPSVPDGEYEDALGWCWTAEENHWNWHDKAYYDGNNACGYLPVDIRPEKYQNAILATGVVHDVNAYRSDSLRVNVYTREARVRLSINGKVIGEQDVDQETLTATFWVAYEPGELRAEVVKGKKAEVTFNTSKAPAAIKFETVSQKISSSANALAYVYIKVVDRDGNLCPTAEIPLEIRTSGVKHVAVAGTGHPYDMQSFRSLTPTSFRGQALTIIQPQGEKGSVTISVSSPKLKSCSEFVVELE
ncbi:MAG: DUF4982 domain-containing protein [Bacteroidales bacterium]|nr:DUF4982 domain-containing protein [Bacteroidales bacterium]